MRNFDIILGTALWGWVINKTEAFGMLDEFYGRGYCLIDTATNYPINKNPDDYLLAVKWLAEWSQKNKGCDLKLILKVGSIDNLGSADIDLSRDRIIGQVGEIQEWFPFQLYMISIHWDNRAVKDLLDIQNTIEAFSKFRQIGYEIGLSGIKNPSLYFQNTELGIKWCFQVKENIFTSEARLNYTSFFPENIYYAYGINQGGIDLPQKRKLVSTKIRDIKFNEKQVLYIYDIFHKFFPSLDFKNFNQIAIIFTFINPFLSGVIIGPRTLEQLSNTLDFINYLNEQNFGPQENTYNLIRKSLEY